MQAKPASAGTAATAALRRLPLLLSLTLFLGTLLLYLPALNSAFVNYDDPAYVTHNLHVLQGLSWRNIVWAFTATVEANWHPVTWISHMADVEMFGTNPRGHHAVNVVLHAMNVVLLFFLLRRATGYLLRSGMVAALFAVHPLNVECVAWVAERKSVLSMLFFLLALLAYGWFAHRTSAARYGVVAALFAIGLAAKPMIITLPILLLLWDYWPLRRIERLAAASGPAFLKLVAEKVPLLALSGASAWITLYAQRSGGALGNTGLLPFRLRIGNAIYSYIEYIAKGIWPSGLAVFYPHPEDSLAPWKVLLAASVIVVISVLAWLYRERRPYLIVGWLWYLVAMAPMIGVVQVGRQAMADRYAYLPFIGLFVIGVWGCCDLFEQVRLSSFAKVAIAAGVLVAYASIAFVQIYYWHNSYTLFAHALQVTSRNGIAEDNFGDALMEMGRPDLAMPHFELAAEFVPQLSTAHYNLGVLLQQRNELQQARRQYELALQFTSDETEAAQAHSNLGFLLLDLNDLKAAEDQFTAALQFNPEKQNSLLGRGIAEYRLGKLDAAVADLSHANQIAPLAQADFWLGRALEDQGKPQAAANAYAAALQLAPTMADAKKRLEALQGNHR